MKLEPHPFDFTAQVPEPPLNRLVASVWAARGKVPYRQEKVAPTGSTVAVFVLGDPILCTPNNGDGETLNAPHGFLVGPHDRPIINSPTGETYAAGIVTTSVGCEAVFGIPPATLRGQARPLLPSWPPAIQIRPELEAAGSLKGMLDVLVRHLGGGVNWEIRGLDRCARAVAMLEEDPSRPVAEIATALRVSHGHLDRELGRVVGLTPRVLSRLLRVRRLLQQIDVDRPEPWVALAADNGWADQAHLIRDFKRHTGVTPSAYVAAQRAAFSSDQLPDAAGFVPEA